MHVEMSDGKRNRRGDNKGERRREISILQQLVLWLISTVKSFSKEAKAHLVLSDTEMFRTSILLAILATLASTSPLQERASVATTWWKPAPLTRWQIVLDSSGSITIHPDILVYDIDLFDTPQSTISALHKAGKKVICYISAGTYENWRPDASQFPPSALGNAVDGWAGERWVDTRSTAVRNIMTQRIALASSKSCDGIDPDNLDGYDNDDGLGLTETNSINYVSFLASAAHAKGLAIGLKNCPEIVPNVISQVDWSVTEECAKYDECNSYQPFISAKKPVFQIEYPNVASVASIQSVCKKSHSTFSTLIKKLALDEWYTTCSNIVAA